MPHWQAKPASGLSPSTTTGQTRFQFSVAGFKFKSESHEWLVISGAKAKYKRNNTINGEGTCGSILTVIDADVNDADAFTMNRFRIKTWEEDDYGEENVIYDNAPGDEIDEAITELSAGSISIHKPKK